MIPSVEETKHHPNYQSDNNQERNNIDARIADYVNENSLGGDLGDLEHIDHQANYDRILIQRDPDRQTRIAECMGCFSICVIAATFLVYLTSSGSS